MDWGRDSHQTDAGQTGTRFVQRQFDKLGLGFCADELIKRGIITGEETTVYEETTTFPEPTDEQLEAALYAAAQKMTMDQGGG